MTTDAIAAAGPVIETMPQAVAWLGSCIGRGIAVAAFLIGAAQVLVAMIVGASRA